MISLLDENFSSLNIFLKQNIASKIFILVDENTHEHCLPTLLANMETDLAFEIIEIEAGEENKNINASVQLWEILADLEADRKALVINLGGGVVTDMGGFVASTYKRGIPFINIPTSLLAMCDASIGGKTGIDHQYLKNIIGTFAEAEHVFIYPDFLESLDFVQLRSGFAEMLKHGLIADAKHWKQLVAISELSVENLRPHILRSTEIKQEIVEKDFKEQNIRKNLNFGHTVGHAIESLFLANNQLLPHGEAVALGMIIETHISYLNQLTTEETSFEIITNIQKFFPYIDITSFSNNDIIALMLNDKKNANGAINFSLIEGVGIGVFDQKVSEKHLILALNYYRNLKK
ncbi:3-dehydroquinate synthase [Chryseobacterium sp. POL2]|uniref:3-dehydroquinate synthase n=1 Tax=Chryseobacterium sp. POL2 TaxID=2713414 RepID=UPI0013E1ADE9|nr:3-dehydroquinate synthase [Chryseobacterium sp. POL2]QIG89021.1 3-dehydroquinate synthase [Chryseobacterium sp. POL2]